MAISSPAIVPRCRRRARARRGAPRGSRPLARRRGRRGRAGDLGRALPALPAPGPRRVRVSRPQRVPRGRSPAARRSVPVRHRAPHPAVHLPAVRRRAERGLRACCPRRSPCFGFFLVNIAVLAFVLRVLFRPALARVPQWALPLAVLTLTAVMFWVRPVNDTLDWGQINLVLLALVLARRPGPHPPAPRGADRRGGRGQARARHLHRLLRGHPPVAGGGHRHRSARPCASPWPSPWRRRRRGRTGPRRCSRATASATAATTRTSRCWAWCSALWTSGGWGPCGSLLVAVVVIWGFVRVRRAYDDGDVLAALAITGLIGCLVSPISWFHHFVWVLPALAVLVDDGRNRTRVVLAAAGGAAHHHQPPLRRDPPHRPRRPALRAGLGAGELGGPAHRGPRAVPAPPPERRRRARSSLRCPWEPAAACRRGS